MYVHPPTCPHPASPLALLQLLCLTTGGPGSLMSSLRIYGSTRLCKGSSFKIAEPSSREKSVHRLGCRPNMVFGLAVSFQNTVFQGGLGQPPKGVGGS